YKRINQQKHLPNNITNKHSHTTRIQHQNKNATTREGNIRLNPPKKHHNKNKKTKQKNSNKLTAPYKTKQQTLITPPKQTQTTLENFIKI
ncbi:MAG: hypothetical protein Q4Q23_04910, partial [Methanobacteriaceae archaeon]|nr:hypothetical protein [Methanobacteriaceae archaeon]